MGLFDKLKPHLQRAHQIAEEKAKDPEFQAKVKAAVARQRNATDRPTGGLPSSPRRAFGGGGPGTVGYPWMSGHPMYGMYANPGFYDQDGTWCDQDSDGDGVPDNQDAAPNDPDIQTADQADQATYGDQGGETTTTDDTYADDPGLADVPDAAGDTYAGGGDTGGGYDGGGDYGGGDSGGESGGGGGF